MYVIHTSASEAQLSHCGIKPVPVELARDGRPDCFYGWHEPQNRTSCLTHRIIGPNPDLTHVKALASLLILNGAQVVVTTHEDWSEVVLPGPYCYLDTHSH